MRRTKIVCTIGPASESLEMLTSLIEAGCDVVRLNFSHGTHEEHAERIRRIRQVEKNIGKTVAIMLDTKGPEIRTGDVEGGKIELLQDQTIVLTSEPIVGTAERIHVSYKYLSRDVKLGQSILLDDGLIALKVERIQGEDVVCRVQNGGILKNKKGVNIPGVALDLPAVTEKDIADIHFAMDHHLDWIAASFVRKADDIFAIRRILEERGQEIGVIAKIENAEGVQHAEEILAVADGLMVARGDLGVEIPAEDVPLIQKRLIHMANLAGKPVITATQMLDSMQSRPRPTRAEASDVANAIFDGTDAVMLSGETAAGRYPLESVQTMARIAERTEEALKDSLGERLRHANGSVSVTDMISRSACTASSTLGATAIVTPTESGHTARMVAKYRPSVPIIAVTPHDRVVRRLKLVYGVIPLLGSTQSATDEMLVEAIDLALRQKLVRRGDLVIITAGVPLREPGTTNLMKVHVIGEVVAKGQGIGDAIRTGRVFVYRSPDDRLSMQDGDILIARATDRDMVDLISRAGAVVTEEAGLTSHAAVIGISLGIPVIVGVERATETFQSGMEITVDARHGHIYMGQARVL
ncbi:MAG: pyruvate kinase [Candidatus Carbobacillus sp.]|nr:pyruvate kinase [Candidatus Carbobacillus sp.]